MSAHRRDFLSSNDDASPVQTGAVSSAQSGAPASEAKPHEASRSHPGTAAKLFRESRHELQRRVAQLTTLYQIGRAISESRNWTEALDYFLATLCDDLEVQGAGILLFSRECAVLAPRRVLGISESEMQSIGQRLLETCSATPPSHEIHALDCYLRGRGIVCDGHGHAWRFTVLPLLYRRTPLGFLVLDKQQWVGSSFEAQLFFLQTIQTILTEEVANAVHLSRLVDLKNFNEAVLQSIDSGVLTMSEQGEIGFANRLAREILGLGQDEILPKGTRFDALFHAGHSVPGTGAFAHVLAAPEGRCSFHGQLHRRDGRRVPIRLRTSRIVNPSDSQPLILAVFEDLTEQQLLEEQLRRADRLRSLGELSAAIAHEVRNPLQGISLTLSNLKSHLAPGGERYVDVMFQEMERLDSIVGSILSFARPAPPQPQWVSLHELCARACELASERAAQARVQLCVEESEAEITCEVDDRQILQVVLNVLMNAIDVSPPGETVRLRLVVPETPLVRQGPTAAVAVCRIEIRDRGPGIPAELRQKLFDPFFTTKAEGTGLGLAVSQKIVEEHHGVIHVDSEAGGGTRFVIELPRRFFGAFEMSSPTNTHEEDSSGCA